MKITLLTYLGFLSLFCVGLIYYYEDKVRDLKGAVSDYQRALKLSKTTSNADHYTYLQLDNNALQVQVKELKAENAYLRNAQPIQYESSKYKANTWDAPIEQYGFNYGEKPITGELTTYNQDELDLEQ